MFVFVSEPVQDLAGQGASFAIGVTVVRCASMSEALSLSQRLRAALQAVAQRGRRRRAKPGFSLLTGDIELEQWIDELIEQGLALEEHRTPSPLLPLPHRDRDDFEVPK